MLTNHSSRQKTTIHILNFQTPLKLSCVVQHYAWGETGKDSLVAQLSHQEHSGAPCAELWMGAHPKSPALIDGLPLNTVIEKYSEEILGTRVAQRFGNTLPFLFKILSVAEALSIQAHPSKAHAQELHRKDPTNYPDNNHKPEIAIALEPLTMLCGFRGNTEIYEALREFPFLLAALSVNGEEEGPIVFSRLLSLPDEQLTKFAFDVASAVKARGPRSSAEASMLESFVTYPHGDVGLLAFLFLKHITLREGEAVYTGPNVPHAYLKGRGLVECMANSDNVVRAGLTPKFRDQATLRQMLQDNTAQAGVFITPAKESGWLTYETPAEEFAVSLSRTSEKFKTAHNGPEILICLQGKVTLSHSEHNFQMVAGDVYLIPAACSTYEIETTHGSVARAFVP